MMVWRHVWWEVCRSVGLAVALHGCATSGWVHPSQPPADLAADQAACYAQLPQETHGGAVSLYVAEPFWVSAFRHCMQQKGWSPPHWQFSSHSRGAGGPRFGQRRAARLPGVD
jgi:hypothetical protein